MISTSATADIPVLVTTARSPPSRPAIASGPCSPLIRLNSRVMRAIGNFVGRARGMARHFHSGIEKIIREAELEEMEKKWREENERIMQLHPPEAHYPEPGQPDEMPPIANPDGDELPPDLRAAAEQVLRR